MTGRFKILEDDLTGKEVIELLSEHLRGVAVHSPPESIHALDAEGLRRPGVTFWTAWDGASLVGCGALKELTPEHGEIKSMRTASQHLRRGVASFILTHLLSVARARGYRRVSLETGSQDGFIAARALYARFGFETCGPFEGYGPDPNSTFMTRVLAPDP